MVAGGLVAVPVFCHKLAFESQMKGVVGVVGVVGVGSSGQLACDGPRCSK